MLAVKRKQMAAIGEVQLRNNLADFLGRHVDGRVEQSELGFTEEDEHGEPISGPVPIVRSRRCGRLPHK